MATTAHEGLTRIVRTMKRIFAILLFASFVPLSIQAEVIELEQLPDVALEHQRMPGNARAQAERRGIIRSAPHLFVYHRDLAHTPAFYMNGIRRGFKRHLELMLNDFREQRSMVPLERLLENARRANGEPLAQSELSERRVVMVVYHEDDCEQCVVMEEQLDEWLSQQPRLDPIRIRILLP